MLWRTLMVNFGLNSVSWVSSSCGWGCISCAQCVLSYREITISFRCHRFTLRLHSPVPRLAARQFWSAPPEWISYFFAVESIRLRGVATEQAKRNTPIVDEDRPVSRVYRDAQVAELDELEPEDERPIRPRIRGSRDVRSTRTDEYEDEAPRLSR